MVITPLLTDLYQFTMFDAYVLAGKHTTPATFDLFFRSAPDGAPFAIACGLDDALNFIENFKFTRAEVAFLKKNQYVSSAALKLLRKLRFDGEILAIPEGTPVLPHEPILRVTGPLGLLQLLESPLLNIINYQTLIATKASRMVRTAWPATITEFGLRRAHGPSAAIYAVRASVIAGAVATSNVEAAREYFVPAKGTMAHSYVMSFESEIDAFRAYVKRYPRDAVLLVDTFDTLKHGMPNAITVALELRESGGDISGIRIDSGNLVEISKQAREMLDDAGLTSVNIFASNELDEYQIETFKKAGAKIDAYGVGTRLVTAYSQPALGGIFKLAAVKDQQEWIPKMKTTSDPFKATLPGRKTVFRVFDHDGKVRVDIIAIEGEDVSSQTEFFLRDLSEKMQMEPSWTIEPLLRQAWLGKKRLHHAVDIRRIQKYCLKQVSLLPKDCLALTNPRGIPCLISKELAALMDVEQKFSQVASDA